MSGARRIRDWAGLVAASAALGAALDLGGVPAAWLLGPMVVAIGSASTGATLTLHPGLSVAAQALIGCVIAHAITPGIFATLARDWVLFLAVTLSTVLASGLLGYLLARWRVVPGTVAIWGSSPGGATAMVILAQAFGADARLVAVMVYLRVVMVAGLASIVALIFTGHLRTHALILDPAAGLSPSGLALTLAVAGGGVLVGRWLKMPAGALICTMALGAFLNLADVARVDPPRLLMIPAYLVVGWRIGLGFTRETLRAAAFALPRLIMASGVLIGFGGLMAVALVRVAGVDPLTAYLATSPGGMDAIAVIASTSAADAPFVMALQVVRFVVVIIAGPALAMRLARTAV